MKRVVAILFAFLVVASPLWAQEKIEQVVARVNGDIIA